MKDLYMIHIYETINILMAFPPYDVGWLVGDDKWILGESEVFKRDKKIILWPFSPFSMHTCQAINLHLVNYN